MARAVAWTADEIGAGQVVGQLRSGAEAALGGAREVPGLDETFTLGEGQQLRIVAIDWEIDQEFRDAGFDAIFFEPL